MHILVKTGGIGGSLEKKTRHVSISNAAQLPTYLQIYLTLT